MDAAGLAPGEPVPALVATGPVALALLVGGAGSGRPLAPLGPLLTARELSACVEGLAAPVLVAEPPFAATAEEVSARTGCRVAVVDGIASSGRALRLDRDPGEIVCVIHTSGTSGVPKPVPYREDRLAARVRLNTDLCSMGPGDVFTAASPFHHIGGLGNLAVALGVGAATVPMPRFSVDAWVAAGERGVTHALLVPTMIDRLLEEGALAAATGLRVLQYGGAPMHPSTLRRAVAVLPGVQLVQMYGQTEGSPLTCLDATDHARAAAGDAELLGSVGRAVPGVELRVAAPDATGLGEVCARGPHLCCAGADGWLHTGDLGRLGPDGLLRLAGRLGDRIVRGGENVDPAEVESIVAGHPQVREVAVVGVPDRRWGEVVKAFVVPADPASPPDVAELRAFARVELAGFKVPAEWTLLGELPRNAAGKVLRRALRDAAFEGT
jgi:acyl-CoA synthetase (AMP-forming)/AMP-acid ligase II